MREPPSVPGVEHAWVEANGVRLHVADTGGDKPPVLLLHGWPQHWWEWRDVIPLLAPHHRVIAPDLRGFGWSDEPRDGYAKDAMAADIVALLDALGIDQVDLVAHDWGGWIGLLLCLDHPERIRRYLVTNTGNPLAARDPRLALESWRLWYQVAIACGLALRPRVNGWLAPRSWSPQERAAFLGPLSTPAGRRLSAGVYGTFLRRELPALLAGVAPASACATARSGCTAPTTGSSSRRSSRACARTPTSSRSSTSTASGTSSSTSARSSSPSARSGSSQPDRPAGGPRVDGLVALGGAQLAGVGQRAGLGADVVHERPPVVGQRAGHLAGADRALAVVDLAQDLAADVLGRWHALPVPDR